MPIGVPIRAGGRIRVIMGRALTYLRRRRVNSRKAPRVIMRARGDNENCGNSRRTVSARRRVLSSGRIADVHGRPSEGRAKTWT